MIRTALFAALLLAACVSPEEQAAQRALQEAAEIEECHRLGYAYGSEGMASCRLQLRQMEMQRRQAIIRAFGGFQQPTIPTPQPGSVTDGPLKAPERITCQHVGNYTYCQ